MNMWRPVTYGEELFLTLHKTLGANISIHASERMGMDFLTDSAAFESFAQLSVTLEIFMRCVRLAKEEYGATPHSSPHSYGKAVRSLDLPFGLSQDGYFCELLKHTGRICVDAARDSRLESEMLRNERKECYLCGQPFIKGHQYRSATVEHIWPISFGGETVTENLLPACGGCNSVRSNMLVWAWGPVQSTFHTHSDNAPSELPKSLRLSLALARIQNAASGLDGRKPRTLKEAAKSVWPAVVPLQIKANRPYLYFELLKEVKAFND